MTSDAYDIRTEERLHWLRLDLVDRLKAGYLEEGPDLGDVGHWIRCALFYLDTYRPGVRHGNGRPVATGPGPYCGVSRVIATGLEDDGPEGPEPRNIPLGRDELGPAGSRGLAAFWGGAPAYKPPADLKGLDVDQWRAGWWSEWARCYAEGREAHASPGDTDGDSPYPQFSGAWEAWAEGWNEAAGN